MPNTCKLDPSLWFVDGQTITLVYKYYTQNLGILDLLTNQKWECMTNHKLGSSLEYMNVKYEMWKYITGKVVNYIIWGNRKVIGFLHKNNLLRIV